MDNSKGYRFLLEEHCAQASGYCVEHSNEVNFQPRHDRGLPATAHLLRRRVASMKTVFDEVLRGTRSYMRTHSIAQKMLAVCLALLLVSCSVTRSSASATPSPKDLARYAIIFETQPDGSISHTLKLASQVDLTPYWSQLKHTSPPWLDRTSLSDYQIGNICTRIWTLCDEECMDNPLPRSEYPRLESFGRNEFAARKHYCAEQCRRKEQDCRRKLKQEVENGRIFESADEAIEWVKQHKVEIAAGGVFIIAGIAFVAFVCAGGCVILAPLVLLASAEVPGHAYLAEARP